MFYYSVVFFLEILCRKLLLTHPIYLQLLSSCWVSGRAVVAKFRSSYLLKGPGDVFFILEATPTKSEGWVCRKCMCHVEIGRKFAVNNKTYLGLHVKCVIFSSDFNTGRIFSWKTSIPNFTEISQVGAVMIHADRRADGQTDRHTEAKRPFPCVKAVTAG